MSTYRKFDLNLQAGWEKDKKTGWSLKLDVLVYVKSKKVFVMNSLLELISGGYGNELIETCLPINTQ